MSHVIAPSTADGAYHYYKKISFQLYFITQEVNYYYTSCIGIPVLQPFWLALLFQKKNIKQLPVNLVALKEGLSSLLVPSQEVLFGTNLYVFTFCPKKYF